MALQELVLPSVCPVNYSEDLVGGGVGVEDGLSDHSRCEEDFFNVFGAQVLDEGCVDSAGE